jgi:hypothetical protein
MPRLVEQPVTTLEGEGTPHERYVTRHPAYGQISASRVSGGAYLYGSDFHHHRYIAIRIAASEAQRHLSNDWHFSSMRGFVEIAMSEDQWHEFQSSMNSEGTPCTIESIQGVMIPSLPAPESRTKQFAGEAEKAANEAFERIEETMQSIANLKISEKAREQLLKQVQGIGSALTSSLPFILDQFGEHMEKTVAKAKVEINAHAAIAGGIDPKHALEAPNAANTNAPRPKRLIRR